LSGCEHWVKSNKEKKAAHVLSMVNVGVNDGAIDQV
jgi:hypothetical protein